MAEYLTPQARDGIRKVKGEVEVVAKQLEMEIEKLETRLNELRNQSLQYKAALASLNALLGESAVNGPEDLELLYVDSVQLVAAASMGSDQQRSENPLLSEVIDILRREPNGLHYKEVYTRLKRRGVQVAGQNPELNLSTQMARCEQLERIARGTYRLRPN